MTKFEYKVLPAPARGVKVKGVKTTEDRFAHALMSVMNDLGEDGWEYVRADTLPCEERTGLTGKTTRFQNMLIFRREMVDVEETGVVIPFADAESAAEEAEHSVEITPTEAADRIASTLTAQPVEGTTPTLHTAAEAGDAPKLGSAAGNGMENTEKAGVAAE